MRTSNMTEGGPKSSTQKRKKKRIYCPSSCAGTGFFAPSLLPVHIDGSSAGCAALLLPCPLSIHATSKLWQLPCVLVPPTLVPCCRPLFPACVAYFLAPHCCRCCRTKRPLVKVAGVACSAMRVDSISNISIHSSACPLANDAPTAYLGAPNCCPLHVHIDGLPLLATAPFCVAINVITFSNCIQSVHGLPTHPLGDLRLIPIVPAGRGFSRQFQPGNFPAVSVIRFANRISRLDIDDSRQN